MSRGAKAVSQKSKSTRRQKKRAGVATAALMTAAMGATVTLGAGPASAFDFGPFVECAGGSGTANNNVDCTGSIDPPVGELLPLLGLPVDLDSAAAARENLYAPWPFGDKVLLGGTTAKISGPGLAYANSQFASAGSTAEANAWGFLSAAVAVNLPQFSFKQEPGTTKATSLPLGVTIAFAGAGDASALALGGFATAIGDVPLGLVENVSCMAIFAQASHSDVGSCVGVLFIFSVSQEAGSPEYVFAIADPTSLEFFNDDEGLIPLPIPNFGRDILRVGVGGQSGIRVETDLFQAQSGSSASMTSSSGIPSSTRAAAAQVADETPGEDISATNEEAAPMDYVGKHRAPEAPDTDTADADTDTDTDTADTDTADTDTDTDATDTDTAGPDDDAGAAPETLRTEPETQATDPSAPASSTDTVDSE